MKRGKFLLASLLASTFFIKIASAYSLAYNLQSGAEGFLELVQSFLTPFFLVFFGGNGEFLFEKALFFLLVFTIVYIITKEKIEITKDKPAIYWTITICVSLLATRFLTESTFIQTILLPYTTLGIALASAIPLLIYFYFAESFKTSISRKISWIFFAVVYLGIWYTRKDLVGNAGWIYAITAGLSILFMLIDGTIQRAFLKQKYEQLNNDQRNRLASEIREQIATLEDRWRNHPGVMSQDEYDGELKRLYKELKRIKRY
ncbi:MAG: hypothetical protein ACOYT4_04920 [Nanoarchaeota archaeon]